MSNVKLETAEAETARLEDIIAIQQQRIERLRNARNSERSRAEATRLVYPQAPRTARTADEGFALRHQMFRRLQPRPLRPEES